ncbi:MAG: type 1 fimbrial protein [Rhodanobacter sp.]|nr:type 1 fimbrial protein [Rhodanobacter sp.]
MKKTLLSAAMIAGFGMAALAPMNAQAASSGTINFSGKVLADTCTIAVNGGSTVALPTVMTAAFGSTVGTTTGATNFTVGLTGCDTNMTSAQMAFTTGGNVDSATGNLKNAAASGSNVEIQLLSGASVINAQSSANAPAIAVDTTGAGSTTLTAQYISTATATTAGLVTSSVGFTLTYQ